MKMLMPYHHRQTHGRVAIDVPCHLIQHRIKARFPRPFQTSYPVVRPMRVSPAAQSDLYLIVKIGVFDKPLFWFYFVKPE